jgi:hypothetical protein
MDKTKVAEELDRLVVEDIELGGEIARLIKARDVRMRFHAQQAREEAAPFEREIAPLQKKRDALRETMLGLWMEHHGADTTVDLPSARVSRRNYMELVVRDKEALVAALDRADRLDLMDYAFDDKAVARLITEGKLTVRDGAVEIIDNYNFQIRPWKEKK